MVAGNARASEGPHRSAANLASRLPLRVISDILSARQPFSALPPIPDILLSRSK